MDRQQRHHSEKLNLGKDWLRKKHQSGEKGVTV